MRGTIQAPAADAIAAEHAHPPACHQLNYPICGESRCSAARCHDVHGDGGIRAGGGTVAAGARPAVLPAGQGARDTIMRRREREVSARGTAHEAGFPDH